jgi:hypothetical protein
LIHSIKTLKLKMLFTCLTLASFIVAPYPLHVAVPLTPEEEQRDHIRKMRQYLEETRIQHAIPVNAAPPGPIGRLRAAATTVISRLTTRRVSSTRPPITADVTRVDGAAPRSRGQSAPTALGGLGRAAAGVAGVAAVAGIAALAFNRRKAALGRARARPSAAALAKAPVKAVTKAAVVKAPVKAAVKAVVKNSVRAPVKAAVKAVVKTSVRAPVKVAVKAPVRRA